MSKFAKNTPLGLVCKFPEDLLHKLKKQIDGILKFKKKVKNPIAIVKFALFAKLELKN